tara:strand:- start:1096 stop:2232 length:1137 start_codon:yes stop_codon:yes gene_type:complete
MAYGQNMNAPMAGTTGLAALKGRQGDNTLVHVNPMELKALDNMAPGGLTRNPYTGLPEAFKLKDILPALGAVAGAAFLGPMMGLTGALSAGAGAGLGAAGGTALAGGNTEEIIGSGLMSGATAGLGSYLSGAGQTVGGLEDAAFDKALGAQGITDGGVGASQAQLDLANTAAIKAGDNAVLAGVPSASQVAARTGLEKAVANVGGLGGAATTGLAAMAPMMAPEIPEEGPTGPIQSIKTENVYQGQSKEDIDKFIRQGGTTPQFFEQRVLQPGIYRQEGGSMSSPEGRMFSGMVEGRGDGMSDEVAFDVVGDPQIDTAMLSPDEYVMDAYTVAALGNGSSDAGAEKLDAFRTALREKVYGKQSQPNEIDGAKELNRLA